MRVRFWEPEPRNLELRLETLERLWTERTRLVAFTHASNLVGTIHDVGAIARWVHARGGLVCVDGVAYAPHRRIDTAALDVDFYAFSLYKVYGPHCAALYVRREHLERIPGINHFFLEHEVPYKLQPGNVNYEMTYALLGLWDYVAEMEGRPVLRGAERGAALDRFFARVGRYEEGLVAPLLEYLEARPDVQVLGEPLADRTRRVPTVSFVVEGRASHEIPPAVDRHRIGIRYGDFYARRLVDRLGLGRRSGVVRVSLVHYNTAEEVGRLLEALDEALGS